MLKKKPRGEVRLRGGFGRILVRGRTRRGGCDRWISEPELRAGIGPERAKVFISNFAGMEVYIPTKPRKRHQIAEVMGYSAMIVLCREYGKQILSVPNPRREKIKKEHIVNLLEQGMSNREIVQKLGVTCRYVQRIKALNNDKNPKGE